MADLSALLDPAARRFIEIPLEVGGAGGGRFHRSRPPLGLTPARGSP